MVVTSTQLLAREYQGKLDAHADQIIGYAVEGALRMSSLLRNLREYWWVSENRGDARVQVDCNLVLDKVTDDLKHLIRESGAEINYGDLPTVLAEEVQLLLLFQNLISNAIKYHRPGELPHVDIRATQETGVWHFSVTDDGIGVEGQYLDQIFVPFKRLHGSDEYPGSGLGLAICKRIVERLGGRIWAESTGQGSVFHFTIPSHEGES
jgi:light-regulated signal transduction histidine kinase (bacteriophytochrome)